jgi:hypothetical protein
MRDRTAGGFAAAMDVGLDFAKVLVQFLDRVGNHLVAERLELGEAGAQAFDASAQCGRHHAADLAADLRQRAVDDVQQPMEFLDDRRLVVGEVQREHPFFRVAYTQAVEEGDDFLGALGDFRKACGTAQEGGFLEHFAHDAAHALGHAAEYRDQRHHQYHQQDPLHGLLAFLRVVDQADDDGDQVAHGGDVAHQGDHADHRVDEDLREAGLLVECALHRAPCPTADIGANGFEMTKRPAGGRCLRVGHDPRSLSGRR